MKPRLEVHEHHFITGPKAFRAAGSKFAHSHEGGDVPHVHDDAGHRTGPAAYTIDRDEWRRATGLVGGGRKKFTPKPTGLRLPLVRTEPSRIEVIIVGDGGASVAKGSTGGASAALARMQLTFGAEIVVTEERGAA